MRRILAAVAALALMAVVVACKPTVANPPSASNITHSTANLSATVNPQNHPTTYFFEYGTTTSYGQTTASFSAGAGTTGVTASAVAQDLVPNTTYHYRISATNVDGTQLGADATFTTATCSPGTALTITTGGTYSGCYVSTVAATPAVTISTTGAVVLDHARVEHKGRGVQATAGSADLDIHDSTFIQTDPGTTGSDHAVYAYNALKLKFEHNLDKYSNGVYWSAPDVTETVGLYRYNKVVETEHWSRSDGFLSHALQTDKVTLGGLEVAWNEFRNTFGQSNVEDIVNFYDSNGTSAAWWDVHHNLFDGAYPASTGVGTFNGGGLVLGDANGSYQKAHENIFVSTTNQGPAIPAGSNLEIYSNAVINDGYAGGVITGPTYGNGTNIWDNPVYTGAPSTASAHDNLVGFNRPVNATTLERADYYLPACDPSTACTNNSSVSGTIDAAMEQTARNEWDTARITAVVATGPRP